MQTSKESVRVWGKKKYIKHKYVIVIGTFKVCKWAYLGINWSINSCNRQVIKNIETVIDINLNC